MPAVLNSEASPINDRRPPKPPKMEGPKDDLLTVLVRQHLRLDERYHDPLLQHLMRAGMRLAEKFSGCPARPRTVRQSAMLGFGQFFVEADYKPFRAVKACVQMGCYMEEVEPRINCDGFDFCHLVCCTWCGGKVEIEYCTGPTCLDEWIDQNPDLVQGVLLYVGYSYENAGCTDTEAMKHSGAFQLWKSKAPLIACARSAVIG